MRQCGQKAQFYDLTYLLKSQFLACELVIGMYLKEISRFCMQLMSCREKNHSLCVCQNE